MKRPGICKPDQRLTNFPYQARNRIIKSRARCSHKKKKKKKKQSKCVVGRKLSAHAQTQKVAQIFISIFHNDSFVAIPSFQDLKMADVSDYFAPASVSENSSPNDCYRPVVAGKTCSGCGELTKGHLGPYGLAKRIVGATRRMAVRVDKLEKDPDEKDQCIPHLEALTAKRQEGLLATIQVLEDEVTELRNRLEETLEGVGPCIGSGSDKSQCGVRVD